MNYFDRIKYDPETGIFTWAVSGRGIRVGAVAGSLGADGYWAIKVGFKRYRSHRVAWFLAHGQWPEGEIDHINGNPLDNRLCNLRVVGRAENSQNRRRAMRNSSHGFLGASWNGQHKRWQAKLMAYGVRYHLGYFDSAELAHAAYMAAKSRLHIDGGCH